MKFKPLVYSSLVTGTLFSSAVSFQLYYNNKNNEKLQKDENFKDTTRENYENYGLDWGAKADQMIADKLDTGDLLFVQNDCQRALSFQEMLTCVQN